MFDNNVFIEESCKNTEENGIIIGYEMQTNITYYRGIPLSMVNDISVKVDGEQVERESIRCSVDNGEYWFTLDEMTTVVEHKWEYGEPMTVKVIKENGLSKGEHAIELTVNVRTAYIPVPLVGVKKRLVTIG